MPYYGAQKYLTPAQAAHMGRVSQKIQALQRMAQADHGAAPVRSGLQLAIITLDCRTAAPVEHCALLIDAGYTNRYRWILDHTKQHHLVGWHAAGRAVLNLTRPLISA